MPISQAFSLEEPQIEPDQMDSQLKLFMN